MQLKTHQHSCPYPTTTDNPKMYTFSSPDNTSIVGFSKSSQSTSMIQPQNFMPILGEWKSFYQIGYGTQPCKCHTGNIHMSWALIFDVTSPHHLKSWEFALWSWSRFRRARKISILIIMSTYCSPPCNDNTELFNLSPTFDSRSNIASLHKDSFEPSNLSPTFDKRSNINSKGLQPKGVMQDDTSDIWGKKQTRSCTKATCMYIYHAIWGMPRT